MEEEEEESLQAENYLLLSLFSVSVPISIEDLILSLWESTPDNFGYCTPPFNFE